VVWCLFFFQAEDGIRDDLVTGVQTCALPICRGLRRLPDRARDAVRHRDPRGRLAVDALPRLLPRGEEGHASAGLAHPLDVPQGRSEERRVGKEWRRRGWLTVEGRQVGIE